MGLCSQIHDNPPDAFFMVDCYRRHNKYRGLKHDEWLKFSSVDVAAIDTDITG